jgi:DNA-binding CsgD family transcriptional regulator/cellobiose-specific phosphotransferase system component IIA
MRDRHSSMSFDWTRTQGVIAAAQAGHGGAVVLEGAAQSGKTWLAGRILADAAAAGVSTVDLSGAGRVRDCLTARAGERPLVVMFDGIHRLTPENALTLRALLDETRSTGVMWLLTRELRSGCTEVAQLCLAAHAVGAVCVELLPWDENDTVAYLRQRFSRPPDQALTALARTANGKPALLSTLVDGLLYDGFVDIGPDTARLRRNGLPELVLSAVGTMVRGLSEQAANLLTVAAGLQGGVDLRALRRMLRLSAAELCAQLAEAVNAGVIVPTDTAFEFCAELVRSAITELTPAALRLELTRDYAQSARSDDPAGMRDDVLTVARKLADEGRYTELVTCVRDELARTSKLSAPAAELAGLLAAALLVTSDVANSLAEAERVLQVDGASAAATDTALAVQMLGLHSVDVDRARAQAVRVLAADRGDDQRAATITARLVLATEQWDAGRLADGLTLLRRAVQDARSLAAEPWLTYAETCLAMRLVEAAEFEEADTLLRGADDRLRQTGCAELLSVCRGLRAHVQVRAGHPGRALSILDTETTETAGSAIQIPVLALIALRAGDLAKAARCLHRSKVDLQWHTSVWCVESVDWIGVQLAEAQYGQRHAMTLVAEKYGTEHRLRRLLVREPAAAPWIVRVAMATGDLVTARRACEAIEGIDTADGFSSVHAASIHARALLRRDSRALSEARQLYRESWARAQVAEDIAAILVAGGGSARQRGVEALQEALSLYTEAEAARDFARVRSKLRSVGVYETYARFGEEPAEGFEDLTEIQLNITKLVADGLTNRQIATQVYTTAHTVNFHLRKIFRKLGVNSRVELAGLYKSNRPRVASHSG